MQYFRSTSNVIKKTKRHHQLWTDWQKLKLLNIQERPEMIKLRKQLKIKYSLFSRPMSGRWYYTYSNDKGMTVGLAKLMNPGYPFTSRYWMWETCTTNEDLELRRFPTQKAAEEAIYKFLS